jgi:hypothetical protein
MYEPFVKHLVSIYIKDFDGKFKNYCGRIVEIVDGKIILDLTEWPNYDETKTNMVVFIFPEKMVESMQVYTDQKATLKSSKST